VLHVDPWQNLVHLVVGAYLAGAAGGGASGRATPWLLVAAGSALPLAAPSADLVSLVVHLLVVALALTVAATRRRPAVPGAVPAPPSRPSPGGAAVTAKPGRCRPARRPSPARRDCAAIRAGRRVEGQLSSCTMRGLCTPHRR